MFANSRVVKFLPVILLGTILFSFAIQKINGNVSIYDHSTQNGYGPTDFESHLEVSFKNDVSLVYLQIVVVLLAFIYPLLATSKNDVKNFKSKCLLGFLIGLFSFVAANWGWYGFLGEFGDFILAFWYAAALVLYLIVTGIYYVRIY